MSEPIAYGESVLLIDSKGRHYLVRMAPGGTFQYHRGILSHDEIVGCEEGVTLLSSNGGPLTVLRPRLADFILKMQRGAQVVYPKDIGPILVWADIAAGMTVIEAGTGSGALAIALARAVGPTGRVISVERRADHAAHARKSITRWFGDVPGQLELRAGEVESLVAEIAPERVVLDLPEPWHAASELSRTMAGGGVLCAYLPTVPQVQTLVSTLREAGVWGEIEVTETLYRTWNVAGRSVRPDHQMVGHTGFLVVARKLAHHGGGSGDEEE